MARKSLLPPPKPGHLYCVTCKKELPIAVERGLDTVLSPERIEVILKDIANGHEHPEVQFNFYKTSNYYHQKRGWSYSCKPCSQQSARASVKKQKEEREAIKKAAEAEKKAEGLQ